MNTETDDQINLKNIVLYGYHGVTAEEGKIGCRFNLGINCGVDLNKAAQTDDVDDTISYALIFDAVQFSFSEQRFNLLETLSQHIVDHLFAHFATIEWVQIAIDKPEAPMPVVTGEFGIKITRMRPNG